MSDEEIRELIEWVRNDGLTTKEAIIAALEELLKLRRKVQDAAC